MSEKYLAVYDVRGIQSYIYRTPKLADAIGASILVENILMEALKDATKNDKNIKLDWYDRNGPVEYDDQASYDVEVLFIGGGNAYVLFSKRDMAVEVNKRMSRYLLDRTYSLQLACALWEKSDDYAADYRHINEELTRVKAQVRNVKPLGSLPIMKTEIMTGYPAVNKNNESTETISKKVRKRDEPAAEKILDELVTKKGEDSVLAVVHIDGNNMGQRIRGLLQDEKDYTKAVNRMRRISYNISHFYRKAFDDTKQHFDDMCQPQKRAIREIIVAGDDITYICNDRYALESVHYFCQEITKHTLNQEESDPSLEDIHRYGFSICAGIAFIGSHFPFSIGYDAAEELVKNAKDFAKAEEQRDGDRIGNYVDFQIVKNIHGRNLKEIRKREYVTPTGETLHNRPYYIKVETDSQKLQKADDTEHSYRKLCQYMQELSNKANWPRSRVKTIRNTYPLGQYKMNQLIAFMASRHMELANEIYAQDGHARYYDALELIDMI